MTGEDFRPAEEALVEDGPGVRETLLGIAPSPHNCDGEDALLTRYEPERVDIRARLCAPGLLVLLDAWYPGWVALVDGTVAPILRVNYYFRGVMLPAGEHTVQYVYQPRSLAWGAGVTAVSGIILLGFIVVVWLRARGPTARQADL